MIDDEDFSADGSGSYQWCCCAQLCFSVYCRFFVHVYAFLNVVWLAVILKEGAAGCSTAAAANQATDPLGWDVPC